MHLLSGLLIIDAVNDGNLPTIVTGTSTHHNPSHHVQTRERCNAKSIHKKSMYWFEDMNVKSFVHYTSIESTSPRLMREATIIISVGYHPCSSCRPKGQCTIQATDTKDGDCRRQHARASVVSTRISQRGQGLNPKCSVTPRVSSEC